MGITIAYQGQLADADRVEDMVRDVRAFADYMNWRTWTFAELVAEKHVIDTGLRGITVSYHPKCDALHFHIDSSGRLVHHGYYSYLHDPEARKMFILAMQDSRQVRGWPTPDGPEEPADLTAEQEEGMDAFLEQAVTYNWTKTQFGGPEGHIQACTLLRFVRDRYAPDLKVKDDTGYFDHGRLDELKSQLGYVDKMLHLVQRATERISEEGNVTDLDGLLKKLQRYMGEERDMLH